MPTVGGGYNKTRAEAERAKRQRREARKQARRDKMFADCRRAKGWTA
jgi:hypothetical protein